MTFARAFVGQAEAASANRRRPARLLLRVAAAVVLVIVAFVSSGVGALLSLPDVGDARARVAQILAEHHASASATIGPRLGTAVVAAEDEHFYSNFAVDILDGMGRAALATLQGGGDPGGSTITQQLAKQLYGDRGGLGGTLADIGLAVKLSLRYSKPQILSMYLNAVYYGNGDWGEKAAARGYFGTTPQKLDWAEAAMLAGVIQAPSADDPLTSFARAKQRQRYDLRQLVANHVLSASQASAAYRERLPLR